MEINDFDFIQNWNCLGEEEHEDDDNEPKRIRDTTPKSTEIFSVSLKANWVSFFFLPNSLSTFLKNAWDVGYHKSRKMFVLLC